MDEQNTTETEQNVASDAIYSRRFRFARRFAVEFIIIALGVSTGVAFANWRGVPDRFANIPSLLAQATDVVGEAISQAVTPGDNGGKTVEIELRSVKNEPVVPAVLPPTDKKSTSGSSTAAFGTETVSDASNSETPSNVLQDDVSETEPVNAATSTTDMPGTSASGNGSLIVPIPGSTYRLTIQLSGAGSGIVQSVDTKIVCGSDCTEDYPKNFSLILKAYEESGSLFSGWSTPCGGTGPCGVMLTGDVTVTAFFNSVPVPVVGTEDDEDSRSSGGTGNVLISEIMAGSDGNSDNEFVELYNPTDSPIALTGWMLKKKISNGTESVFVSSARFSGKVIPARGYFLIVHEGLYQGSTPADMAWPSSYNIAYSKNGLVLYSGTGSVVETVSWTDIPVGQSYARTSWDGAIFSTGAPTPQNSSQ